MSGIPELIIVLRDTCHLPCLAIKPFFVYDFFLEPSNTKPYTRNGCFLTSSFFAPFTSDCATGLIDASEQRSNPMDAYIGIAESQ
jgi:hypothetical protein